MSSPLAHKISVRQANREDSASIHGMIRELAVYEKLEDSVTASLPDLENALFGLNPSAEALVGSVDGSVAGFALFFTNYSTFVGRPGIYLEDLFVQPKHRGHGLGKALLKALARLAVERRCGRMDWSVLDWNQPAIDFYENIGANVLREWLPVRLDANGIRTLAQRS